MTKQTPATFPPEAFDRIPRVSLTLTDESAWLTRYDPQGCPGLTYPVRMDSVAEVFNQHGAASGLLPEGVLFWQTHGGQERIAVWLPPATRTILYASGKRVHKLAVPLPGFVFIGHGAQYAIYAALKRPLQLGDRLYHAPLSNVYDDGRICAGDVRFPVCAAGTIHPAAALFFESHFNEHISDGRIKSDMPLLAFLQSLDGARTFPASQLLACTTLQNALSERPGTLFHARDDELAPLDENDDIDPYQLAYEGTPRQEEDL